MNFKIGVLYAKDGQSSDDDFFSNGKITKALRVDG